MMSKTCKAAVVAFLVTLGARVAIEDLHHIQTWMGASQIKKNKDRHLVKDMPH